MPIKERGNSTKKLLAIIVLAFTFLLASCNASFSSGEAKSNLEGQGYTVEVMDTTEAKARVQGVNYNVTPQSAIFAAKGNDKVLIFFFSSIDEADKFVHENIAVMVRFAEGFSENPKTGCHNNAAYTGSIAAAKAAGFPVSE